MKKEGKQGLMRRCLLRLRRTLRQMLKNLSTLKAKAKQLLGFFQVATRVADVYETPMPESVSQVLAFAEVLNINIGGFGLPLQCMGIDTYKRQLAITMLAPLVVAGAVVLGFVVRACCSGGQKGRLEGLFEGLPWLLTLSFLVFPMVSLMPLYLVLRNSIPLTHCFQMQPKYRHVHRTSAGELRCFPRLLVRAL